MSNQPNHDDLTEQERAALESAKLGITSASSRETANDLEAMAADPDIQREYTAIAYEFKNTEMDGLTDEPQPETVEINGQPVPVLDWRGNVPVVPGNMVTEPQPEAGGDECSMCGGKGELEATLVDDTRESVACPACLQKQLEAQLASQQRELREAQAGAAAMRDALIRAQGQFDQYTGDASASDWIDDEVLQVTTAGADLLAKNERLRKARELAEREREELRKVCNRVADERDSENRQKRQIHGAWILTLEQLAEALGFASIEGQSAGDLIDRVKQLKAKNDARQAKRPRVFPDEVFMPDDYTEGDIGQDGII